MGGAVRVGLLSGKSAWTERLKKGRSSAQWNERSSSARLIGEDWARWQSSSVRLRKIEASILLFGDIAAIGGENRWAEEVSISDLQDQVVRWVGIYSQVDASLSPSLTVSRYGRMFEAR